jgi:Holliday junction resolvase
MAQTNNYVRCEYIPLRREYDSHAGLSEKEIKKRLEKKGYEVWRGAYLGIHRDKEQYPNVIRKYRKLEELMIRYGVDHEYLEYINSVHHGMPDYITFRRGEFLFVECKLGHEQLSRVQKRCIALLKSLGYRVEVHKMVFPETKARIAIVDLQNGSKIIRERQMKLLKRYNK